jgi:hypothetical protein
LVRSANADDFIAMKAGIAIGKWTKAEKPGRWCARCSKELLKRSHVGGWVVFVPSDAALAGATGICTDCIGKPDLIAAALARLERDTGIVIKLDYSGHGE